MTPFHLTRRELALLSLPSPDREEAPSFLPGAPPKRQRLPVYLREVGNLPGLLEALEGHYREAAGASSQGQTELRTHLAFLAHRADLARGGTSNPIESTMQALARVEDTTPTSPGDYSGAQNDWDLVGLWIGQFTSPNTIRNYLTAATRLLDHLYRKGKVLRTCALAELADWSQGQTSASVSAAKSLLSFAHSTGYCTFNVGVALRPGKAQDNLAERILTEEQVFRMLAVAGPRDLAILKLLYGTGMRVSEACGLRWEHVHADPSRSGEAVLTVHGKGGKTRHVRISPGVYACLLDELAPAGEPTGPVLRSRRGLPLDPSQVWKVTRRVARKAGLGLDVSPHWFRHAHASHAMLRGAPVHLVQATLGHASVATTSRYLHASPTESSGSYLGV